MYKIDTHFVTVEAPSIEGIKELIEYYYEKLHADNVTEDAPSGATPTSLVMPVKNDDEAQLEAQYKAAYGKRFVYSASVRAEYTDRLTALRTILGVKGDVTQEMTQEVADDGGEVM